MAEKKVDIAVLGGGLVGLACAFALTRGHRLSVALLEAEAEFATQQSGRNSGVIHAGLYYRPGSEKASLCTEGRHELYACCERHGILHERCGKLVVASTQDQTAALEELERRGAANGLESLRMLSSSELSRMEPDVRGHAALFVPQTGIVDYRLVANALAEQLRESGVALFRGARVTHAEPRGDRVLVRAAGVSVDAGHVIACAGLQADRVARLFGVHPKLRIVPFRGDYYRVRWPVERLRRLVYPVPDPRLPFLGVHLTRTVHGELEAGPNAAPALHRTSSHRLALSPRDAASALAYRGLWKLLGRHRAAAWQEVRKSLSRRLFAAEAARLVPALTPGDLHYARSGVRAQALTPEGEMVDDFRFARGERSLHVLNAPSPAATACLAIGKRLAREVVESR